MEPAVLNDDFYLAPALSTVSYLGRGELNSIRRTGATFAEDRFDDGIR